MRTIGGGRKDYERVAVDEWLTGEIAEVQYDEQRQYNVKDKETGEWSKATAPHVRFKFKLDGYQYPHYSRWMKASTFEKSNLYGKYLKYLCPKFDCADQLIDLDKLQGIQIKVMFEDNNEFQNVTQIRGLDPDLNIIVSAAPPLAPAGDVVPAEDEPPF